MKHRLSLFLALFFLVLPGFGMANEGQAGEESLATLEEVVVTAGRVKEKKKEITTNVTVITEEEIRNSSALDLGDLLAEKAIGHIQKYPDALTSVGIRGFRTETHGNDLMGHVLILLNGRRAGTGNVAKILTNNIERIEIIRGPASVQYGSAAMGGVVNVITKQGRDRPTGFVSGVLGSFDHEEWSIGGSGKVKRFDFSGSFMRETMDDYDTASGKHYYNTGYKGKENYSINLGFEFLPENRIGVIFNRFNANHVGSPSCLSQNDLDDYIDEKNSSIDFIYDGGTTNGLFSWKVRYFDGQDENKWFDPLGSNPDFWDNGIPDEMKTDQKGAQAQVSLNHENLLVTTGCDWVNYEMENTWNPKRTEYDNPSCFMLARTKVLDQKLIISGGLRCDKYEVKVEEPAGRTENDSNLSPRFGIAYLLTDCLKLRANYGEAFVMPAADQMAADYTFWGIHSLGNPDLKPEKSKTYEGGLDFSYRFFNSTLTYFYTDFRDKIEPITKAGNISTWRNAGEATIEGVECEFSCDIGGFFEWNFEVKPYFNCTYLAKYRDNETGLDLKYTSDLQVSYGITISDSKGLSANLNLAYTGKQKVDDWESGAWPAPVVEKSGFTLANFTISKKILDYGKYGRCSIRGEIQNLLDKDYEYVKGYPMPGRSFFIGLRYDL